MTKVIPTAALFSLSLAFLMLTGQPAQAASASWSSTGASSNWSSSSNWGGSTAPGSTSVTNSDIATFNSALGTVGTSGNPVVIDSASQYIGGLTFDTASVGAFFIGSTNGNSLLLTSGGAIQLTTTVTATETINAPLVIQGANGTYSLLNNSSSSGALVIGGRITGGTAGATSLTLGGSSTSTNAISGVIANGSATSLAITVNGAGTWLLSGTNTYSGGTTVGSGTVTTTTAQSLGTGTVTLNGGTLQLANTNGTAIANAFNVAGSSALITDTNSDSLTGQLSGAGTLNLTINASTFTLGGQGGNTLGGFSGTIALGTGTNSAGLRLNYATNGTYGSTSAAFDLGTGNGYLYNRNGNATFNLGSLAGGSNTVLQGVTSTNVGQSNFASIYSIGGLNTNTVFAGKIKDGATNTAGATATTAITKVGTGTLTLTGANTYSGGTTLNAGALAISNNAAFGTGTVTFASNSTVAALANLTVTNAYAIASGATGTFDVVSGATLTNSGVISGSGALSTIDTGTLTLTGANTYSGGTTLKAGALAISNNAAFGTGTVTFASNSTVTALTNLTVSNNYNIASGATGTFDVVAGATLTNSGVIAGSGALTKIDAGTLNLSGTNSFTGGVTLNAGTILIGATGGGTALGSNSAVTLANVSGAQLNINGFNETIGSLAGGGTNGGNLLLGVGTLTLGGANSSTSFGGTISGAGGLNLLGTGTLTLSATDNSYTGTTTINSGATLSTTNFRSLGASAAAAINLNGGTLQLLTGNNTFAPAINVATSSTITAADNENFAGPISGSGTLNLNIGTNGNIFSFGVGSASTSNTLAGFSGTIALGTNANLGTFRFTSATNGTYGSASAAFDLGTGNDKLDNRNGGATFNLGSLSGGSNTILYGAGASNYASIYSIGGLNTSTTFAGLIAKQTGDLAIVKVGTGTLTLTGSNTYGGGTTLNSGALAISNNAAFGTGTVTFASNSTVAALANLKVTNAYNIASGATGTFDVVSGATLTNSGVISGSGALTKIDTGTLTLSASNSYSGGSTISSGTLVASNAYALAGGPVTVNGGTLNLANINETVGAVTLGSGSISGSGTLTGTSYSVTNGLISASLGGSGTMTQNGSGTVTLLGANSYSGATAINGGTLKINGTNTASAVSVNSGGTLGGSGSAGAVTVASGGTLSPGNSPGNLTVTSSIWNNGGSYNWQVYDAAGVAGTGYDTLTITGALNLSSLTSGGFNINIWSLSSPGATNGLAINFNALASTNWTLATYGSITGSFNTNLFAINTAATNGTAGFANSFTGTFGIATNGSNLLLTYSVGGGSSSIWSGTSGNLSTIGITNDSNLTYTGAGGNVTNNAQVTSLSGITYSNTAGSYNFSGSDISNGSAGIVNNSSASQTVALNLTLGTNQTFNAASGNLNVSGTIANAGNNLTIAGANSTTLGGIISGSGGLTKTGSGTATLSAADTFSGTTAITGGTLVLSSGASLASTNINVGSGSASQGILNVSAVAPFTIATNQTLSGYGSIIGDVTVNGNLNPGLPSVMGFSNNLTLGSTATTTISVAGLGGAGVTNGYSQINVLGNYQAGGALVIQITGGLVYNDTTQKGLFNIFNVTGLLSGNYTNVTVSGDYSGSLTYYALNQTWQEWNLASSDPFATNNYVGINMNSGLLTVIPEPQDLVIFGGIVSGAVLFYRRRMAHKANGV